jgi:hypothetical protein
VTRHYERLSTRTPTVITSKAPTANNADDLARKNVFLAMSRIAFSVESRGAPLDMTESSIILKCTSPHWRDDLKTLLQAGNDVKLIRFKPIWHAELCLELASTLGVHFNFHPTDGTASFTGCVAKDI